MAVTAPIRELVRIPAGTLTLEGQLVLPAGAQAAVLFAHGSGSSRSSPRNTYVAGELQRAGLGTLLFDLLTEQEDEDYERRFDIELLTDRLIAATRWMAAEARSADLKIGYFGASTGAAAALLAAADLGDHIGAVVSRGGRPDMAQRALPRVTAPTLLIVGGSDDTVIALNELAYGQLRCLKRLVIVPGATHLFEEPGTLEQVAGSAAGWFTTFLAPSAGAGAAR